MAENAAGFSLHKAKGGKSRRSNNKENIPLSSEGNSKVSTTNMPSAKSTSFPKKTEEVTVATKGKAAATATKGKAAATATKGKPATTATKGKPGAVAANGKPGAAVANGKPATAATKGKPAAAAANKVEPKKPITVPIKRPSEKTNATTAVAGKKSNGKAIVKKESHEKHKTKVQKKHKNIHKREKAKPHHSGSSDSYDDDSSDSFDDDSSDSYDGDSTDSYDGSSCDCSDCANDDGSSCDCDDCARGNDDSSDSEDDSCSDSWSDVSSQEENNNYKPDTGKLSVETKSINVPMNNKNKTKKIKVEKSISNTKPSSTSSIENNNTKSKQQQQQKRVSIGTTSSNSTIGSDYSLNQSSIEIGRNMFQWLLGPVSVDEFYKNNWEQKPCYINSGAEEKYMRFISFKALDQMLISNNLEFTTNVDIIRSKNGKIEKLNPEGRATPPSVWSSYADGCSIRFLNPHVHLPNLYKLNSTLQEYFHSFVGANAYLTPPNSQGFAPQYDDIEAFVLQVEGRKRWRLYAPMNDARPRVSKPNFKPDQIGEPIFDQILGPGDILYFPRGIAHQTSTIPGFHSLHMVLSVYEDQTYADLLGKLMQLVLKNAMKSELNLHRVISLDTFQNLGLVNAKSDPKGRIKAQKEIKSLLSKCLVPSEQLIDAAVDQLAKKYQHEALPPVLSADEQARSIAGSRSYTDNKGVWQCGYKLETRTGVRLMRANILRLVREDDASRIYYHVDNDREYCKSELNFMEIKRKEGGPVEMLIRSYPAYVSVSQFPLDSDNDKIEFATALWERGLLIMEKPFK